MLKNPTPKQIAFFSSLYIGSFLLLILSIFKVTNFTEASWTMVILISIVTFTLAYGVIIYYLKRYIYRKIKLIYKTIHQHKISPEEKNQSVASDMDIISEVEKEVTNWADTQAKEIQNLKSWQEYRRKFLGDISHELKTPIFNIQGYLETLLEGGLFDKKINSKFLKKAAKNVERLNTIVEDLDAISRLESGNLELDLRPFDIKKLAAEVFEDLEIKARKAGVKLLFKSGADLTYLVNADRENVRQVLMNLVTNSIKYGNNNGNTKVGFYDMDKNILIEVADNGIGIPQHHLNHVFDRFYRVDKSRSRAQGGSGLGLAIVKHIIEAHKQTINVRSTVDLGSTFGFTLEKA
ncbi:MAG: ATP-binding protein [Bacteroidetes bacterium]|jgi:two-component system phosphate regulon sensor histidine kinase PhoR|nr:ATP-binding protein [Bacteroidota bacterium]MDF1865749.1 ATP-binding protein [Saprospiraceae bacterium]